MKKLERWNSGPYYMGKSAPWGLVVGRHRDSDALERANFETVRKAFSKLSPEEEGWTVQRFGHWAVGWVEELVILPSGGTASFAVLKALVKEAHSIQKRLDDYPVLDEELWSQYEAEEEAEA